MFGNVFGMDRYKEENSRYSSFTVRDNNNLQVLQNKLNRLILDAEYNTPTEVLFNQSDSLSIQQMIAYQTAVTSFKIIQSKKPTYIADKLNEKSRSMHLRGREGGIHQPGYSLSISREGFIYRSASLFNMLDENLRNEEKLEKFKAGMRSLMKENILTKPKPTFSTECPILTKRKICI